MLKEQSNGTVGRMRNLCLSYYMAGTYEDLRVVYGRTTTTTGAVIAEPPRTSNVLPLHHRV